MKKRILFIFLIVLLITEVVLHLFFSDKLAVAYRPVVYRAVPVVNYGYVQDTCFSIFGEKHYINKQGFIGPDFSEKSTNTFRIAIIGASSVAGSINLKTYCSFCPLLQENFSNNNMNVEILNCGVDGRGRSMDLFKSVRHQVVGFSPDVVLMEYSLPFETWNLVRESYKGYVVGYPSHDMDGKKRVCEIIDKLNTYKPAIDCLYHSYIIRGFIQIYMKKVELRTKLSWYIDLYEKKMLVLGDFNPIEYTMEESVKMTQELKEELKENNIQLFFFQYENNNDNIHIAKNNQIPLISLKLNFEPDDFFMNDGHWNENGCKKIANRFYELFIKHNLIPETSKLKYTDLRNPNSSCW